MTPEVWLAAGAILAAAITAFGAYLSARRASKRMAEIEIHKLDSDEADRNSRITQALIDNLHVEVERLKGRIAELSAALEKEQAQNAELRKLIRELTETGNKLRFQIQVLQQRSQGDGL